jgi:hypothetical protein
MRASSTTSSTSGHKWWYCQENESTRNRKIEKKRKKKFFQASKGRCESGSNGKRRFERGENDQCDQQIDTRHGKHTTVQRRSGSLGGEGLHWEDGQLADLSAALWVLSGVVGLQ